MRWVKYILPAISAALVCSCNLIHSSDEYIIDDFTEKEIPVAVYTDTVEGLPVRWVEVNPGADSLPLVMFVHGAPGGANNWFHLMQDSALVASTRMIALDRLGYYPYEAEPVTDISLHAQALDTIMSHYPNDEVIIVGHSYGGPVSTLHAARNPESTKALFLLAPALDPDNELDVFVARFTWWEETNWAIPKFLNKAGHEKRVHEKCLREIECEWLGLNVPITHLHAIEDDIVPYENLAYSTQTFPDSTHTPITIDGGDHFLPWSAEDEVKEILMNLIKS